MNTYALRLFFGDRIPFAVGNIAIVGGFIYTVLAGVLYFLTQKHPSMGVIALVAFVVCSAALINLLIGTDHANAASLLMVALLPVSVLTGLRDGFHVFPPSQEMVILTGMAVAAIFATLLTKSNSKARATSAESQADDADDLSGAFKARKARFGFERVTGMSDLKAKLLKIGEEVKATVRAKGGESRNGILMFSKPGNGKTMIAEAFAGEMKLPLVELRFGDVASRWVNQTTEGVKAAFKAAVAQAPCVLFIDEVDSFIESRDNGNGGETVRTTNAILTALVDIRNRGVIVVAATNYLDRLDSAAIREGRFDYKVEVTDPDSEARKGILAASLQKRGVSAEPDALDRVCRRWSGFSAARLTTIGIEAAEAVQKAGMSVANFDVLTSALRAVQGHKGRLPENTPELVEIALAEPGRSRLAGIAARMKNVEEIERMGGTLPGGILFYGPPGTGKTLTVRALAKSTGWAFLSTSGSDLLGNPKRIDDLLDDAANLRPAIVFIDEADDVLANRGGFGGNTAVTNKLLSAMDGADGKVPDILFVAATNHPDNIDSAAMRGGRFTEKVEFALPDEETITVYIGNWMEKTNVSLDAEFSAAAAAKMLLGQSMANIVEILKVAVNRMIERKLAGSASINVTLQDLEDAVGDVEY